MAKRSKKDEIPYVDGLKATEVLEVPLEDINFEDQTYQYRFSSSVGDLKGSLSLEGQKEPVDLTGAKPYKIIDGFRRVEAIRQLGWQKVKALLHQRLSEDEAHKLAFLKNVVRKNLGPMEKAHAIFKAKQRGMKPEDLAEAFRLSEKQLKRYEDLLNFPADIQKILDTNGVPMGHAKVLADFKAKNPEDWAKRIEEESLTLKQLKRALKLSGGGKAPGRPKNYVKKVKDGVRLYPCVIKKDAPKEEREKVMKLLKEAIEVLK
ncbi:MAG TPA: ParB/RepB/Spo0J family partition protein [Candidatus Bathyarchaeia archaeon]